MFEIPLVLENELLRLEYLTEQDFEKLYAVASDPLIWEQHPANDRYKREVFKEFFDGAVQGKAAFMVYCKANNELIGSSRYYECMPNESVAIGYTFISRKYWGGTYNTSLKKLMLEYAFRHVPKVLFHVGIHNMRSQKAVGKIGGIFVRETIGPAPSIRPSYEYVLTKAEFEQSVLFKAI